MQKDATSKVGVQNRAIPRDIGFGGRVREEGGTTDGGGWRLRTVADEPGDGFGTRRNWPAIAQKLERSRGPSFLFLHSSRHALGLSDSRQLDAL